MQVWNTGEEKDLPEKVVKFWKKMYLLFGTNKIDWDKFKNENEKLFQEYCNLKYNVEKFIHPDLIAWGLDEYNTAIMKIKPLLVEMYWDKYVD